MEHARKNNRQEIALLLDQEKSYDRVHPSYLRSVLLQFGFPMILVNSLVGLLFGNQVRVNINGHFTDEITQSRGLRQGDPSRGSAVASSVQSRARTISKICFTRHFFNWILISSIASRPKSFSCS
ncbi:hypothetical protein G6F62_014293 [Rhizopus arrhizus]|nr:hypothetical protein G6F62_014293 [Rhizopus arrhizus]